jgi:hypothetical protein
MSRRGCRKLCVSLCVGAVGIGLEIFYTPFC